MNETNGLTLASAAGDARLSIPIEAGSPAAGVLAAWQTDQRRMAIHEASHAVVASLLGIVVKTCDIKGRGHGSTVTGLGDDDQPMFVTSAGLLDKIVVSLAGLEGELALMGSGSNGSESDLSAASSTALELISSGLSSPFIAPSVFGYHVPTPEFISRAIAESIMTTLADARARANTLVAENMAAILGFAVALFAARRLSDGAIDDVLRSVGIEPPPRAP